MAKAKRPSGKLPKSAITGKIVKMDELKKHPDTNYLQTVKPKNKKGK